MILGTDENNVALIRNTRSLPNDKVTGHSKKTSWNNSNTVLVIQRRGWVVTDYKNQHKYAKYIKINVH